MAQYELHPQIVVSKAQPSPSTPEVQVKEPGTIDIRPFLRKYLHIKSELAREFLAEILGTFLLCVFGLSAVAQHTFFGGDGVNNNADFLTVHLSFGLGAVIAVVVMGKISGAHLNPAVSLAMFITGRLSILRFILYSLAQTFGAFLAAVFVFLVYLDKFRALDDMYQLSYAGIFATYPNKDVTTFGAFFDQAVATGLLVLLVMALTDKKNEQLSHGTTAFVVGSTIVAIGCSFAYNAGYAINPARDFGPRLFTLIAGWGSQTFSAANHYFWVPILGPMVGSLVGSVTYLVLVGNNWP